MRRRDLGEALLVPLACSTIAWLSFICSLHPLSPYRNVNLSGIGVTGETELARAFGRGLDISTYHGEFWSRGLFRSDETATGTRFYLAPARLELLYAVVTPNCGASMHGLRVGMGRHAAIRALLDRNFRETASASLFAQSLSFANSSDVEIELALSAWGTVDRFVARRSGYREETGW